MRIKLSFNRRLGLPMLLIVRLTGVLFLLGFSRWLFYIFNVKSFDHLNVFELLRLMFIGIRFDLAAVSIANMPIILLLTIPFAFRYNWLYQKITNSLFVIINTVLIALNLVDVVFFRYIAKRTTSEIFEFFGNNNENTGLLLLRVASDFWYMLLILMLFVWALIKLTMRFISSSPVTIRTRRWYIQQTVIFLIFTVLTVVFARGGLQLKPISLIAAAKYTDSKNIPLLINTPFSIIKTFGSKALKEKNYFDEETLKNHFNPEHEILLQNILPDSVSFANRNVVIIILESLSRNYIGYYSGDGRNLTPFLDSILSKSITFEGFANGKRSIEALPSILAGIPSLMNLDYPSSPYINNHLDGLGTLLKKNGYSTAFFHGGNNGSMGFDVFSKIAGFDAYYGRNEYANDKDFDGQWGIYDEKFLQYTANQLNRKQEPFAAGIFTLSSHHPYNLPPGFENAFPQAKNKIEATFSYLDYSLKMFFETASSMPWFKNTVFIITADHTPEGSHNSDDTDLWNLYAVPLAFYSPTFVQGLKSEQYGQHIDILPSVAALLNIDPPVFSFGRNLFDTAQSSYAMNYLSGIYQFIKEDKLIIMNEETVLEIYNFKKDPLLKKNLLGTNPENFIEIENFSKGVIQQYHNRMIHNNLHVNKQQTRKP
ncbi:MAG: sulfatase-like hydrolase/transferase [Bacteroidales bacterium]|nr:sulfatase-like hydrolase/transferase [Bacteroidales bacterium]